jgi:hypothetical protein
MTFPAFNKGGMFEVLDRERGRPQEAKRGFGHG